MKILLHLCCGPCATFPVKFLRENNNKVEEVLAGNTDNLVDLTTKVLRSTGLNTDKDIVEQIYISYNKEATANTPRNIDGEKLIDYLRDYFTKYSSLNSRIYSNTEVGRDIILNKDKIGLEIVTNGISYGTLRLHIPLHILMKYTKGLLASSFRTNNKTMQSFTPKSLLGKTISMLKNNLDKSEEDYLKNINMVDSHFPLKFLENPPGV